jgi:pyrroline-5-carboxylate reductase
MTLAANRGRIMLVGAGKMGSSMLEGWLALGLRPEQVIVTEPQPSPEITALIGRGVALNPPPDSIRDVGAIVIAVKPQVAADVVPTLARHLTPETVVISIMAGRTIGFLQSKLGRSPAIVRAMPNTPAAIGRGITVAVPTPEVSSRQRELVDSLLSATGGVEWVDDESLMDAVTAVSGSGPAYVFLLAEALARAGTAAGLPAELAGRLARATVAGSGELLHRSPQDAATLRQNVTSPGGTTAAALEVLMGAEGIDPLLSKAVMAATRRSRELAG